MTFEEAMEHVVKGFEIAGVVVLVVGSVLAFGGAPVSLVRGRRQQVFEELRRGVGARSCSA